jgi:NOL1/NOP2/fmu family ribosome biogenesis protein
MKSAGNTKSLQILNRKESKRILEKIEGQWGTSLEGDYVLLLSEKQRVYVVNKEVFNLDLSKLRINSVGMYFADVKNGIRLSIDGSQIIGPKATKNIIELSDEEAKQWMRGEDLDKDTGSAAFLIIKHNNDFLGTGKAVQGKILNFVPKTRRMKL